MASNVGKSIAVGICKRCGKTIEFSPVTFMRRDIGPSCISIGDSTTRELQSELHKNAKYCGECSKEVRRTLFRRLLSLPKLIAKRQK